MMCPRLLTVWAAFLTQSAPPSDTRGIPQGSPQAACLSQRVCVYLLLEAQGQANHRETGLRESALDEYLTVCYPEALGNLGDSLHEVSSTEMTDERIHYCHSCYILQSPEPLEQHCFKSGHLSLSPAFPPYPPAPTPFQSHFLFHNVSVNQAHPCLSSSYTAGTWS